MESDIQEIRYQIRFLGACTLILAAGLFVLGFAQFRHSRHERDFSEPRPQPQWTESAAPKTSDVRSLRTQPHGDQHQLGSLSCRDLQRNAI